MSTTNPTAETLPNPFTCTVDIRHVGKHHEVWLTLANDGMWWALEEFLMGFFTKEEADTHAALILSALHQAVGLNQAVME